MSPRARALLPLLAALALSSCAFYNTYYLARRNYNFATGGEPYLMTTADPSAQQRLTKSIELSKKLLADYPKSNLVDDAYLLWARALLGRDDPLKTVDMLRDFDRVHPKSSLRSEAVFYLGVAYRQAHRPAEGLVSLDEFLAVSKPAALVPYALLERSRVLTALDRPAEAATAAGQVLERFPKSRLVKPARVARAEALLAQTEYDSARADFRYLDQNAEDDEERLTFLLREADCIEGARRYDEELDLLKAALAQEARPVLPPPVGGQVMAPTGVGVDHYGRLRIRVGTANLLAGRFDKALEDYREVVAVYPRTGLAGEAQYRIGYAYETIGDDLEKARAEYGKVRDQGGQGAYALQALTRLAAIDRLMQFRTASGKDSLEKSTEAGFLLAELYLFQNDKPERALEEYRKIADAHPGTPYAGKALNAQGWVLSRKLNRKTEADSLFWKVVHEYPATEAQLAARDYLEGEGIEVPTDLIRLPAPPEPAPDTTLHLTPAPQGTIPLGGKGLGGADSTGRGLFSGEGMRDRAAMDSMRVRMGLPPRFHPADSLGRRRFFGDSTRTPPIPAVGDSTAHAPALTDTTRHPPPAPLPAPGDTTRPAVTPPDTTRRSAAPPDTSSRR